MDDVFDLETTYVILDDGSGVRRVDVDADFWARIQERTDLQGGRMVGVFRYHGDWPSWEMHPEGDEIVCVLSGDITLVLDEPGGERRVRVAAGMTGIVPRNVWHTADVHQSGRALHITRGAGTLNRPRERKAP